MDTMTILGGAMGEEIRRAAILGGAVAVIMALLLSVAWMLAGLSHQAREL